MQLEIVCIDDNEDILEVYEGFLASREEKLVTFTDPEEAIDYLYLNQKRVLMVFSDFKMPKMTGYELRSRMLPQLSDIPFALITGHMNRDMAIKAMECQICKFVDKPFKPEDLNEIIDNFAQTRKKMIMEEFEMISSFVEESTPMLEEIESLILVLEDEPGDISALNTYFRLLHTIKGTAACVGLTKVSDYTHKYEDLVNDLKNGIRAVNDTVIDVLLRGLDTLKNMYSSYQEFGKIDIDVAEAVKIFNLEHFEKENVTKVKNDVETEKKVKVAKNEEGAKQDKVSVGINTLDRSMELSGELTVLRNTLFKSTESLEQKFFGDRDVEGVRENLEDLSKVMSLLQGQITEMRKVSVEVIYRPMKRIVRDASKSLGKDIELILKGDDLRVDTIIAKILNNTLVHLVRNGVDHGVENAQERKAAGKPEQGTVILNSYQDGENIFVEIKDDGKGLDPEKLRNKAIQKGLYTEEQVSKMSDYKIFTMIFESGFSTAEKVTDISGRGVGMDMVRSSVEEIGGKILIDSKLGEGTKFLMILPVPRSVLIINSLMITSKNKRFALPLDEVAEVISLASTDEKDYHSKIHKIEGGKVLKHHNELIPILSLSNVLMKVEDEVIEKIVIVKGEGFKFGLIVDEIYDIEEIVVKKFSDQLKPIEHYLGATLIGDDEIALILNLKGIAKNNNIMNDFDENYENYFGSNQVAGEEDEYMIFSLLNGQQYAIPLDSVHRLEEFKSKSVEYSGSLSLMRYREGVLPLINPEIIGGIGSNTTDIYLEKDILNVIVVRFENKLFGLMVRNIDDIGATLNKVEEFTNDHKSILGTIFINNKNIAVLSGDYLVKNFKKRPGILKDAA
ncbi:MAG: chemotaxis protein CheW [Halobacteriovoraceae bacterium]|nr:chemotaxis protein CheW [Halobacteriovoraceae bacterium]